MESAQQELKKYKNVSRETFLTLDIFISHLEKWNARLNLLSRASGDDLWQRHILDSAQLSPHIPEQKEVLDFGSGAGFPGIVLGILGHRVTLVESDQKKSAFLKEAIRLCAISGEAVNARIEAWNKKTAGVVTARALAPLRGLLAYAHPKLEASAFCLFLKGKNYVKEIEEAKECWRFAMDIYPSATGEGSAILKISDLKPRAR